MTHLPRRRRVRLVWLMLAALLLQQVAFAAHACDMRFGAVQDPIATGVASGGECEHRSDAVADDDAHPVDALCLKHCAPDRAAQADAAIAKLPLLLPPVALPVAAMRAPPARMHAQPTLPGESPPPSLRFCSLLI
jgi:hypothetical protein